MILGDNTYYVSSSTTNDCPQPCHPLSYYITHTATYFTSNVTFIFMEGEHLLDSKGSVQVVINNVGSLTLRGKRDYSNTNVTIICSINTYGLVLGNGTTANICDINITKCGQQDIPPLLITNITSIYIHHVTLYNNRYSSNLDDTGGTLNIHCVTDTLIVITNSIFTNNVVDGNGGGLYILPGTQTHNNITITNSAFTNNIIAGRGGGLHIYSHTHTVRNRMCVTVIRSIFNNNTVHKDGGGLHAFAYNDTHTNMTIISSTFTNNKVDGEGGGLHLDSESDIYNNIYIIDSVFSKNTANSGGGMRKYSNYHVNNNITILNSVFANNIVDGSGGGGGLYMYSEHEIHNNVTITNCTFTSNTVSSAGFGDGGGGLLLYCQHRSYNKMTITNSAFTNNTATNNNVFHYYRGGGGVVLIFFHSEIYNNITFINSTFTSNRADSNGGGLCIYSFDGTICNNITITNSIFFNNTISGNGGGLYTYSYSDTLYIMTITSSTFIDNIVHGDGGGLYIHSYSDAVHHSALTTIVDSKFMNNDGSGLVLFSDKYHELELSRVDVLNNKLSGIAALNHVTVVFTDGHSIVANNSSPADGGGIYLGKDSYLTTSNGGNVTFLNNTAHRYGGAIYSISNDYYVFSIIKKHIQSLEKCSVHDLSAIFINNSADLAGDRLYGGVFVLCEQTTLYDNYLSRLLNCINIPDTIKNVPSIHPLSPVSSHPLAVCPCINGSVDCTISSLNREVCPGQLLNVSLVTVGLCGGVSPGTVVVDYDKQIYLVSNTTKDYTSTSCTTLNYIVKLTSTNISSATIALDVANSDIRDSHPVNVHLTILPCPPGLMIDFTSGGCACNNDITRVSGVSCDISWMPYPLQRSSNNWIAHPYENHNCTIAHIGCPFDYCDTSSVKFNLNEPDLQCNYNRSGVLCGQCIQGLSVMIGSNRCANCTDTTLVSVSIVIIAAVAGIVLVTLLIVLNLTVSVGSINGLLFYANIVKLNESVFFSKGNIPVITQFISWCNLDLGFEYCFIDGLDGYIKTWLQFVFPLYIWLLVIAIIVGCRYSGRLSRLCGRNAVPVLATLILMSYTKLSRTVTNALMMNTLQCGEYKWNVWNVDGNIEYLSGKHIPLFIVSLFFLIAGLIYTGLVFSSQWLQRYSGKCLESTRDPVVRLKPFIDAYTGPFKDKYRFWTGLCLMVRLVLTVVFSFTTTLQSELNNYIIQIVVVVMIVFGVGNRNYKHKHITVLETISLINLICLCTMMILFTESYPYVVPINIIVGVSVSIEILLFIIIVNAHCYLALKKVLPNKPWLNCKLFHENKTAGDELQPLIASNEQEESGAVVRREELIFYA